MPRRHRRAPNPDPPIEDGAVRRGVPSVEVARDGDWLVRPVAGEAGKAYRCPGCDQEIPAGVPHVVAWPADERGDLSDRRHWHTGCWRARGRRAPVVQRSRSAPRYG
jgi:hypothetical protein